MNKELPFWDWSYNEVKTSKLKFGETFCFYNNYCPEFIFKKIEKNKIVCSSVNNPNYNLNYNLLNYEKVYTINKV